MEGMPTVENNTPKVEIEHGYTAPAEFLQNPIEYFETYGENIKSGEKVIDDKGKVREDPDAVKDLPPWVNEEGNEFSVVGKRTNAYKGMVGESKDPFYEYQILQKLKELGLPGANPIAKVEQGGIYLTIMERIQGYRWSDGDVMKMKGQGFSQDDLENLAKAGEKMMEDLKVRFENSGVVRGWKLKDMVFQIDPENKKLLSLVPTDWERTKFALQIKR